MPTYSDDYIKSILRSTKVIAMVGASATRCGPSFFRDEVFSRKGLRHSSDQSRAWWARISSARKSCALKDVPAPVDMVDILRTADVAPEIVREALAEKDRLGIKTIWMQLAS